MTNDHKAGLLNDLLLEFGVDTAREGLRDTPTRVVRSLQEMFSGLGVSESELTDLVTTFEEPVVAGQVIAIREIEFSSVCEHHLLPFFGKASVAYLPNATGRICGLSKVARVLDVIARRPQVQERVTAQLFSVMERALQPAALLVELDASHMCMTCRGVRRPDSRTSTLKFGGRFDTDQSLRADAIRMISGGAF